MLLPGHSGYSGPVYHGPERAPSEQHWLGFFNTTKSTASPTASETEGDAAPPRTAVTVCRIQYSIGLPPVAALMPWPAARMCMDKPAFDASYGASGAGFLHKKKPLGSTSGAQRWDTVSSGRRDCSTSMRAVNPAAYAPGVHHGQLYPLALRTPVRAWRLASFLLRMP